MPNQNNPNQNDPNAAAAPTTDSSTVPPVFSGTADLPPLPPDFQNTQTATAPVAPPTAPGTTTTTTQAVTEEAQKDDEDTGSAAPVDLPPVVAAGGPKKKFGGGRVIATILGIFLLIGGVAGGVLLTQQQQLFEQKADYDSCYEACRNSGKGNLVCMCNCGGECYRPDQQGTPIPGLSGCATHTSSSVCERSCHSDGTSQCKWIDGGCKVSAQACSNNNTGEQITAGDCSSSQTLITNGGQWAQCGSGTGGSECTFCLKVANRTCNQILAERQCGTGFGSCGSVTAPVNVYYCSGGVGVPNGGCQRNDPLPAGVRWNDANKTIEGSFCGTVQVDDTNSPGVVFCSRTDTTGCNPSSPPPPPTPTPTAIPIVAQCQNVKAYSSNWSLLTATQLSNLNRGTTINFCVVGSATGGSFDRARFTINGAAQAETTTKRPNTQDYCQSYTIPTTGNNFAVSAQIHHVTLGWK